jgi:voltage-gated potassium channel
VGAPLPTNAKRRRPRTLHAQFLYFRALLRRFRFTFGALFALVAGGGTLIWHLQARIHHPISYGHALITAYFLLFVQTVGEVPDNGLLETVYAVIPPLGILTVAQGLVQFAFLLFAKQRDDKEWFTVLAQTMEDHVVVCGAGRIGFRIFEQYQRLGIPMVVIERKADAPFVSAIRAAGVAVLIEDVRSTRALVPSNIANARALDARRIRPGIRVVIRLFDDDLVAKVRESFQMEAFSTSAHAAPALAVAALDPTIRNSFEVGGRLMVVAELKADLGLAGRSVQEMRAQHHLAVLQRVDGGGVETFDPDGAIRLEAGDQVALQGTLQAWQEFRAGR